MNIWKVIEFPINKFVNQCYILSLQFPRTLFWAGNVELLFQCDNIIINWTAQNYFIAQKLRHKLHTVRNFFFFIWWKNLPCFSQYRFRKKMYFNWCFVFCLFFVIYFLKNCSFQNQFHLNIAYLTFFNAFLDDMWIFSPIFFVVVSIQNKRTNTK